LNDAKRIAEELYDELRYKQQNNISTTQLTFTELAKRFVKKVKRDVDEQRLGQGRLDVIEGTLKRYLIPFYGHKLITDITSKDFEAFDEWRKEYWTTGLGTTRKAHRKSTKPSQKTLVMEQGILRQILRYGVEIGELTQLPFMKLKKAKTNRRTAFTTDEYRLLIKRLRSKTQQTNHPRILYERKLLELYIRLLIGTGLRIGEARNLSWTDVEFIQTAKAKETLRLWVNGKTGKRAVIGTTAAKNTIKQLLKFYGYESLEEARGWVFTKYNGEQAHTFEIGFKRLLQDCDLLMDRYGQGKTLYCLRHSYATYRLQYGGTDVYLLAQNMGTSVAMIEKHYGHIKTTLAADKLI
jgi:integrase